MMSIVLSGPKCIHLFLDVYFVFQSLLANGPSHPQNKYMKLENEIERSNQRYIEDTQGQQQVNLLLHTGLSNPKSHIIHSKVKCF